ncbi:MAG TPA: dihydrofolate reductase family protein [Brevundimonas sp.]|jgi:dihydrofolate reductase|uniref:dihydrofolate reductase family protein n=1 Tax=Brevundimonas sp. TaxID=1871086 RepID=UPI002EDA081E
MRTIRTATFVSMDGVMQAPGGPTEDPRGGFRFGGWTFTFWDEKLGQLMDRAMGEDYDLLLGRCTYEIFAAFWPHQDDEIGRTFNAVNKYVAAGAETPLDWAHSHRLEGDVIEAVRRLKETEGRDLLIQGSSELIHALLAHDLIDQLTILTFPVVLGTGRRLFDQGSRPHAWTVESSDVSSTGVVVATYRLGGEVPVGSFANGDPSKAELRRRERWAGDV